MKPYIITFVIIGVLALIGTIFAGIQVNKSMQKLEEASQEEEKELLNSNHFKSHKTNFKVLTLIYVFTFLIAIIFILFLFFR
ncbi:putative membrane protein [Pullulanibacillus pueri]|uniref:Uncharacterized protein n=1 Tax=Pullulanibacillus pueri TaxID=1437324 RepID=A0A8J3EPS4_9BACL|nr:DUF5362 family protein [Pullulanibacillus pueri]MBM7683775.1 putative membrane protein [Pullulanibacillus pueri]GGH87284.1 hypothetical protein GCM10007096_36950 [Pullulanibacillus pueri]